MQTYFKGNDEYMVKIRKLLGLRVPSSTNSDLSSEPFSKRRKTDDCNDDTNMETNNESERDQTWVALDKSGVLTLRDKDCIESGGNLNDKHINFAQVLLKQQFQHLGGLASTLVLYQLDKLSPSQNTLQLSMIEGIIELLHQP